MYDHLPPMPDGHYVIGADPAEGNPKSDDSAAVVLDIITGEQMATLDERTDAAQFAGHLSRLSLYYNRAPPGQHDDCAVAVVLALAAIRWRSLVYVESAIIPPAYRIDPAETNGW